MQLRPYQQDALAAIEQACLQERYKLLQAATGSGKTIIFASLINLFIENWDMRIAVVAHREILVRQAYEKLCKVWPEAPFYTGLACSSAEKKIDVNRPVTIGSPQTLVNRLNDMPPVHLLIVDECHRVPPRKEQSQYRKLIERMEDYYPELRILGVTATPYRLGHGYIYGNECKGGGNWWPKLHYDIGIDVLQDQGFLVPYKAKEVVDMVPELTSVSTSKGEFNLGQLSDLMSKEIHVGSAVDAYRKYAADRKRVAIFCVTIEHAERVKEAFDSAGHPCAVVHSKMGKAERKRMLDDFESGRLQFVASVGVLTEGWDSTAVDCIIMCRPTMSPALYVQIVGRGLRLHEGKQDCLILDLSGNCRRHGDPAKPRVVWRKDDDSEGDAPMKTCPSCDTLVHARIMECPDCGHIFDPPKVEEKQEAPEMQDVSWSPVGVEVLNVTAQPYTSRAGNHMLKLTLECRNGGPIPMHVNHFLDIEGMASSYGQSKAAMLWKRLSGGELPPKTVDEAYERFGELTFPDRIEVKHNGKFLNVTRW